MSESYFTEVGVPASVVFRFITLNGTPLAVKRETQVITRQGVPGVGHKLQQFRGEPYQLTSEVDVLTVAAAEALRSLYWARRTKQLDLHFQGSFFHTVYIYDCEVAPFVVGGAAAGGLQDGGVMVKASWKLRGLVTA